MPTAAQYMLILAAATLTSLAAIPLDPFLHMLAAGLAGLTLAALAVRARQKLEQEGAPQMLVASSAASHLGIAWTWGALSILATYLLILEKPWSEWWQFFLGFAFAAAASFAFAQMLKRDAEAGKVDDTLIRIGRFLVYAQLAGMAIGIVSLFVDGKFPRGLQHADWAGCNICFFGALTIAAICADALRSPTDRVMQG